MTEVSIAWIDGDWVAASDREMEKLNRMYGNWWWERPYFRPWLQTSVRMQTWENEPYRATRKPPFWFYKVDGSIPKVWWLRKYPKTKFEDLSMELPFLTRYYFQTHLFLTVEASLFDFVRDYHDEDMNINDEMELSKWQRREPGSVEIEQWTRLLTTRLLRKMKLPSNEYSSTVRKRIFDAIKTLRHKTMHREKIGDDELWYSTQLPELLGDWRRTFEIQQVFMFVRDGSAMETHAREEIDQLLYGPETPPQTLLQAHTWLQHSLERLCFRFTQRNYPSMLKDRKWEWPEQSELQRSWEDALVEIPSYDDFLDPFVIPDDENQLFSHSLRIEVIKQGRELRDAASHRDVRGAEFLRKHALNGILLAIMLGDREQAIEIEATIEAFLTGKTNYQVLTRLRAACAYDRPIPTDQLGERKKREALATYLGDKEVYISEATNELPQITAAGGLVNASLSIPSISADLKYCPSERQGFDPFKDDDNGRTFSETTQWALAVKKFVIGDSMHEVFRK